MKRLLALSLGLLLAAMATADQGVNSGGSGSGCTAAAASGTIGLSAATGSATTCAKSDSTGALSQAIVPTWTGLHTFNGGLALGSGSAVTSTNTGADILSTGTFAQRPGSPVQGQLRYDSTLGSYEAYTSTSGSGWRPVGGVTVIPGCMWASATPVSFTGVVATETNLKVCSIPANFLPANALVRITMMWSRNATADVTSFNVRYTATSGSVTGGSVMAVTNSAGTVLNVSNVAQFYMTASGAQLGQAAASNNQTSGTATGANVTLSVPSTAASFINFNCSIATTTTDSCGISAYTVEVLTP